MSAMRTMGLAPVLPPEASVDTSTNEYVVHLALPGFAREELELEITNRVVTVRGDQTRPALEDGPFLLHERLEETFALPADVDTEQVTAAFARGALELHAPRTNDNSATPRRLPIGKGNAVNAEASGV